MFDNLTDQQLQRAVLEAIVMGGATFCVASLLALAINAVRGGFARKDPVKPPPPPRNYMGWPL